MMVNNQELINAPWHSIQKLITLKLTILQIVANLIGAAIVTSYFMFFDTVDPEGQINEYITVVLIMFIVLVIIANVLQRNWQNDLRRFVQLKIQKQEVGYELFKRVQRKVLDLPYVITLTSFLNWCLASCIMSGYIFIDNSVGDSLSIRIVGAFRVSIGVIISGIITCAIIFFYSEIFCRRIWPYFFPKGGLHKTPGVFRLYLHIRMLITFALAIVLPMILMAVLSYNKARLMLEMDPQEVIKSLLYLTAFLLAVTLATSIILSRLFSSGILNPIKKMEQAMAEVSKGNLSVSVPVSSNDELGILAGNFNTMIEGLKERYRMRQSLDLAKEVQQNLFPKDNLRYKGLDIAGKSIYCDETGGDYFDYLTINTGVSERIAVAIGDVSGHGIASALLMATVRSSIRQRLSLPGTPGIIITDVNRQLARDVKSSGQFMTMFFLSIDPTKKCLHWIRAGHDPAILYDPSKDTFEDLDGPGIALGINEKWVFEDNEKTDLTKGQIILLCTDGVWEARNANGEMFGKGLIYQIIKKSASSSANEILHEVLDSLNRFQGNTKIEDDITLVVVKIDN